MSSEMRLLYYAPEEKEFNKCKEYSPFCYVFSRCVPQADLSNGEQKTHYSADPPWRLYIKRLPWTCVHPPAYLHSGEEPVTNTEIFYIKTIRDLNLDYSIYMSGAKQVRILRS